MRVAICDAASGVVLSIEVWDSLASAAARYPRRDCVEMTSDTHLAEPGCIYQRRATTCRFTRASGEQEDTPRARARLGT